MKMPDAIVPHGGLELAPGVWAPAAALHFSFSRSSGPGGQAVNKLNTRAQLRVKLNAIQGLSEQATARLTHLAGRRMTADGEIILEAQTHRSQLDNKSACIEKLSALVRAAMIKPKIRRTSKPTRAMVERRLESKRQSSEKKRLRQSRRTLRDEH